MEEAFDLQSLLRQTHELYLPLAQKKGLALVLNLPVESELWVSGDGLRLRQVVSNLLSKMRRADQIVNEGTRPQPRYVKGSKASSVG